MPLRSGLLRLGLFALLLGATAATTRREPVAPALVYPTCGVQGGQSAGPDTLALAVGAALIQPVPVGHNLASVKPVVVAEWSYNAAEVKLVEWDPVALAPDPTGTALRTRYYSVSDLQYGWLDFSFVPPVITRSVDHVADLARTTVAWVWRNSTGFGSPRIEHVRFAAAGDPDQPTAFLDGTPPLPLAGPHPVLLSTLCFGDSTLQALRVLQSVGHASVAVDTSTEAVVQRFRVPVACRLRWVEFLLDPALSTWPYGPGTIAIHDAQGQSAPNLSAAPLVQADFSTYVPPGSVTWTSHSDFDAVLGLEPGHDYWLLMRTGKQAGTRARALAGTEGPDFDAGIGEMWARTASGAQWIQQPSRALAFRLIGEPMGTVSAPPLHAATLALRVSPNPVRGETVVQWSGASGAVSLDVLDVRGRRVGGGRLDAAGATTWRWRAVDASGAPLPAGVYFVRASDGAGHAGVQRVVLVR